MDILGTQAGELITALREPARYPGVHEPVKLLETHISWVLLAGEFAYKIKKPLDLGFLDFSSLEARRRYCEAELTLNRRTAPSLYLDVLPITGTRSAPVINGKGAPIEYALRMRRFAQDALLDGMARAGTLQPRHMPRLAATIAAFHLGLSGAAGESGFGSPDRVLADARQNFAQLRELGAGTDEATLRELDAWTEAEHARLAPLLEVRKGAGFVRECHGDLHLRNIVMLGDQPTPFDCIEFSDEFRWIDVMNEVAFLVMDLMAHRLGGLAFVFLNAYLEAGGDYAGVEVLRYYIVYRAMVRAKIARMRELQIAANAAAADHAAGDCRAYLQLACDVARLRRGALLIMHGLSGSGKSTVAGELCAGLQALHLRSDVERKRLHGLAPQARTGDAVGAGIYAPGSSARTYDRLAELARPLVAQGYPVIVDAAFLERGQRLRFRDLAHDLGAAFVMVHCAAPEALLRERVARRAGEGSDASDAGERVLERQLADYVHPGADESSDTVFAAAGGTQDRVRQAILAVLGGQSPIQ